MRPLTVTLIGAGQESFSHKTLIFCDQSHGVGRASTQAAIDCVESTAFVRLRTNYPPTGAVALMREKILPFCDIHEVRLEAIFTAGGRVDHLNWLSWRSMDIEYRPTLMQARGPTALLCGPWGSSKTGSLQRRSAKKWYSSIDDLQRDLAPVVPAAGNEDLTVDTKPRDEHHFRSSAAS